MNQGSGPIEIPSRLRTIERRRRADVVRRFTTRTRVIVYHDQKSNSKGILSFASADPHSRPCGSPANSGGSSQHSTNPMLLIGKFIWQGFI